MSYIRRKWKSYCFCAALLLSYNGYFIYLMRDRHVKYLLYLDFLLGLPALILGITDCLKYRKREREKRELFALDICILEQLPDFENRDIAEHEMKVMQEKLREKFNESCELQDFVAKWCHELKLPLSAALLLDEKIKDSELRETMREQLERMNGQLNSLLLGCKLQSPLFDLQIKQVSLPECVRTSVKNNQFFLIRDKFQLEVRLEEVYVYTDPAWLVYILDQLINNALKYAAANQGEPSQTSSHKPRLCIRSQRQEKGLALFVEDNGVGIQESDLRRVFEKGFTGSNYHNGKYRSTGMGLYMAAKIAEKLEHEIFVESEYGSYARFCILFRENGYGKP